MAAVSDWNCVAVWTVYTKKHNLFFSLLFSHLQCGWTVWGSTILQCPCVSRWLCILAASCHLPQCLYHHCQLLSLWLAELHHGLSVSRDDFWALTSFCSIMYKIQDTITLLQADYFPIHLLLFCQPETYVIQCSSNFCDNKQIKMY